MSGLLRSIRTISVWFSCTAMMRGGIVKEFKGILYLDVWSVEEHKDDVGVVLLYGNDEWGVAVAVAYVGICLG
jgi:hypothetical protein